VQIDRDRLRIAGWVAAAALVALLGLRLTSRDGDAEAAHVSIDPPPSARPPSPAPSYALVQVAGEVRRPGVYRVPRGARAHEAVELAGGLTARAEQAGVNLVARVQDGQQLIVPRRGAVPVPGGGPQAGASGGAVSGAPGSPGAGGPAAKVSLATATPEQLDGIDGIGPTLARRIVEYRQARGGFRSVDELRQVEGIGEKRFATLRKAVVP
jgi:competence protein ComEA